MLAYGSDRLRVAGEKVILLSAISKGWQARTPKSLTHAEFPGTAVLWEEQYFEVLSADLAPNGGVRYVLVPWRDDHTIRVFDHYDAETEAARIADYKKVVTQQKRSVLSTLFAVILGHLPAAVQRKLANEYGVSPARMTLISIVPIVVFFSTCVWLAAGGAIKQIGPPIPIWLWLILLVLMIESAARFHVAMAQDRPMGSMAGYLAYILFWAIAPNRDRFVSPFAVERGNAVFTLPTTEDVAHRDAVEMRMPIFTLLPAADQHRLAQRYGYNYRQHATGPTLIILLFALLGAITSYIEVSDTGSKSAMISLVIAVALTIEQIYRLQAFKRRPAGSVLGVFVRPFVRSYLRP